MCPSTTPLPQSATQRLALRLRVKLVAVPLAAAVPELYALPAGGECPQFERGPEDPSSTLITKASIKCGKLSTTAWVLSTRPANHSAVFINLAMYPEMLTMLHCVSLVVRPPAGSGNCWAVGAVLG